MPPTEMARRSSTMPAVPVEQLERPEFGLSDFVRTLRRRKWIIFLCPVIAVAAVTAYTVRQPPVYQSTSGLLLVAPVSTNAQGAIVQGNKASIDMPTMLALATSSPVVQRSYQLVHRVCSVRVAQLGSTEIMDVTAFGSSPLRARECADGYAEAFIDVRTSSTTRADQTEQSIIKEEITALQGELATLDTQQTLLAAGGKADASQLSTVQNKINTVQSEIGAYDIEYRSTEINQQLNPAPAQQVNPAGGGKKVSPQPLKDALFAAVAGLMIGIGLAFLLEFLDDRIRTKDDLERAGSGLPVVGVIPEIGDWRDRKQSMLVSVERPRSPEAEAYRALRTAVQFLTIEDPVTVIEITSPAANDGKTATTANLATALAMAGQRVVAVSCDLRRPRLHEFFHIPNTVGLTSVLLGEASLSDALWTEPQDGRLHVLPSGPNPPNPSELLAGRRVVEVFDQLRSHADIVLIDSPPVLPVTDAAVLAGRVDAVLIVGRAGMSTRRNMSRSLEILARVNAPMVGSVLNSASSADSYGYGTGYGYRYGYGYGGYSSYGRSRDRKPVTNGASTANGSAHGNGQGSTASRRSAGTES